MYAISEDFIRQKFNVPVKIDWELGVHQDGMMELHEEKRDEKSRTYKFHCNERTVTKIMDLLKTNFKVEYEITKKSSEMESLMELFITKRAFSRYLGTERTDVSGNLYIEELN